MRRIVFSVVLRKVGVQGVRMSAIQAAPEPKDRFSWRDDLHASRDLSREEIQATGSVVGWFEDWRVRMNLPPGLESAREFWRQAVVVKPREPWQLKQWAEGIR